MNKHKILIADSRSMPEVPDKSVHLVITSPPYWQLKDYDNVQQIGFHDTYEEYINNLNLVWKECHRVLHDGCRLCINIGDQPVSIKPQTYESKQMLPESIGVQIIYYDKVKDGINIFFEE